MNKFIKKKLSRKSKKLKFSLPEQLQEQFASISGGNIRKIKSKKILTRKTKSRKYRLRKSLHFPYSNNDIFYLIQEV
jgi:hypothetical protein